MRRSLITLGAILPAAVIGLVAWRTWPVSRAFYTDADTIKTPKRAAAPRDILWQPPQRLPGLLNSSDQDYEPRISADGLTLLFVRRKPGDNADIHYAHKTPDGWTDPAPLVGVNSDSDDLGPVLSHDGRSLYFYSNRAGSLGGYDLWMARRMDDAFEFDEAINLGPGVNSPFNEYGPSLTSGGDILYFSSNRPLPHDERQPDPDAWQATLREDLFQRAYDLYVAVITERGVGSAGPLTALNTPFNEGAPAVSPVGDFLYFASDRPGGEGGFDLYRSRRLRGGHEPPDSLGATVNSRANDLDPSLGMGGYALYFSTDRGVPSQGDETGDTAEYDLYLTTSREVFLDAERLARPPIDWAALFAALWPNLLWMLIALALLLLLWALMRNVQDRRVGLLTKCLLASMLAHLVLVLLLTIWGVSATLAGEFRRGGKIQVALASPAGGHEIATQITGALTSTDLPTPKTPDVDRAEPPPTRLVEAREARLDVQAEPVPLETASAVEMTISDASARLPEEIARDTEPQALQSEPMPLAVSTPSETSRVSEHEQRASLSPSERPIEALRRPEIDPVARPASSRAFELTPTTTDQLFDEGVLRRSLAEEIIAGDSVPAAPTHVENVDVQVPAELLPAPGLQLAMVTSERLPMATEQPRAVRPREVNVPSVRVREHMQPDFETGPVSELAPAETAPIPEMVDASNEMQLDRVADARPAMERVTADVAPMELPLPEHSALEVSTPTESRRVADAGEHDHRPAPSRSPVTPRPREVTIGAPQHDQPIDELEPDRVNPGVDASLLAAAMANAATDTPAPDAIIATPDDAAIEHATADAMAFDLPALEEAASPRADEPAPSYARVLPADVRAGDAAWLASAMDANIAPSNEFAPLPTRIDEAETTLATAADVADSAPTVSIARDAIAAATPSSNPNGFALELGLPAEETPPEHPYLQRSAPNRMDIVKRHGGGDETEQAVARALRWLARHQEDDGHWNIRVYDRRCGGCDETPSIHADVALTGLATLCFLGAGHTHDKDGPYSDHVARAIDWLLDQQAGNGDLRGQETMYTQGIAAIALSEALAMTHDERLRQPVELALRFIYAARNRREGGWRYDPGQAGDTSVLGWMMMAMKSAALSGVAVPRDAFNAGADWLEKVADPRRPGLYAYRPERDVTPSMTAEGMFIQQLLGHEASEPMMQASAEYILRHLPDWEDEPNTYYWYYASLAMFQHGGDAWRTWNEALKRELVEHQRTDGRAGGSWDPQGNEWSMLGGRVYQTALCTLMLEVYYRYLPLYAVEEPEPPARPADAVGMIAGVVRDAASNQPLVGATVRLDIPDGDAITARTDRDGFYYLWAPELPPYFALSASHEGYTPDSINVDGSTLESNMLDVDFVLEPADGQVVVTEAIPEVHHLGDDRFDGRINSRFQKQSEGAAYGTTFAMTREQLAGRIRRAEVRLLAKGVQRRHKVLINGVQLDRYLDDAPSDGSFGKFVIPFDPDLLLAGSNTIEIVAKPSRSDIDDFEFVNVQIHLNP